MWPWTSHLIALNLAESVKEGKDILRRRCGNIHKAYTCLYIHFFKRLTEHLLSTGLCSMSKGHSNSSHRASLLIEREAPKIVRLLQIMINAIKNCNSVMRYSLSRGVSIQVTWSGMVREGLSSIESGNWMFQRSQPWKRLGKGNSRQRVQQVQRPWGSIKFGKLKEQTCALEWKSEGYWLYSEGLGMLVGFKWGGTALIFVLKGAVWLPCRQQLCRWREASCFCM